MRGHRGRRSFDEGDNIGVHFQESFIVVESIFVVVDVLVVEVSVVFGVAVYEFYYFSVSGKQMCQLFVKKRFNKGEFAFQNVFDKLVVSAIEVVKHPSVEELEQLDSVFGLLAITATHLVEVDADHVKFVQF